MKRITTTRIISKAELSIVLSIDGRALSSYRLKKYFFTPEILNKIGITDEQYRSTSTFGVATTAKILEVLQITEDELSVLRHN